MWSMWRVWGKCAYRDVVGEDEGKGPLRRPNRRLEGNNNNNNNITAILGTSHIIRKVLQCEA